MVGEFGTFPQQPRPERAVFAPLGTCVDEAGPVVEDPFPVFSVELRPVALPGTLGMPIQQNRPERSGPPVAGALVGKLRIKLQKTVQLPPFEFRPIAFVGELRPARQQPFPIVAAEGVPG